MSAPERYRAEINLAYGAMEMAATYEQDGAPASAALKLREAAAHFDEAARIRQQALNVEFFEPVT